MWGSCPLRAELSKRCRCIWACGGILPARHVSLLTLSEQSEHKAWEFSCVFQDWVKGEEVLLEEKVLLKEHMRTINQKVRTERDTMHLS